MDTTETDTTETITYITYEQFFEDAIFDLVRLLSLEYTFTQLTELLNQPRPGRPGMGLTTEQVIELFSNAVARWALAAPDGRVEVEVFGTGKGVKYFLDPDYPQGTVQLWADGRQWLLVRKTPPQELPRLPRERWPLPWRKFRYPKKDEST